MSKLIIYILVAFTPITNLLAQKNIDFIISVNEQIVAGNLSDLRVLAVYQKGDREVLKADYYPGNLSIAEDDYKKLLDTSIKTIYLLFNYIEYENGKPQNYSYEIDLKKGWLTHYFFILHIYNTSKKKYRNLFINGAKNDYLFEFSYPSGGTKLIRRK